MQLLGLSMLEVAGVFAGVGALVVGLYFLRVRRREILVPFAPLFEDLLMDQQRERLFGRLRWLLSLLLALLFCASLAFALGDPRRATAGESGRALVVLLDVSASMASRENAGAEDDEMAPTRLDEAKRRLQALIQDLGPSDRMLLATLGERATPRTGLTGDVPSLERALSSVAVEQAGASLDRGLELAIDVLEGEAHAEIVLVGDGEWAAREGLQRELEREEIRLSALPVGRPSPNVGILSFGARRLPLDRSRTAVSIELSATPGEDRRVELSISDAGHAIYAQHLVIPAGTRLSPSLPVLSGADHALTAELRTVDELGDSLDLDNHAYALLPARRRSRVLAVSRGDLYLSAALLLDEVLDVTEGTPEEYAEQAAREPPYDVIIFDEWLPPEAPRVASIYLRPEPSEGSYAPLEVTGELASPYFSRLDRRAPLLRFTALRDVNIGRALAVRTQPGDHVLGASPEGPLLLEGSRDGVPFLAFTFAPRESDLVLRVAWPILLLDAIEGFGDETRTRLSSMRTGTSRSTRLPPEVQRATLTEPNGERLTLPVQEGVARVVAEQVGIHRLEFPGGVAELAANLGRAQETLGVPPTESTLWGERVAAPSQGQPGLRREIWPLLVLFALLWLLLEGFAWHRRWTL